MFLLQIDQAIEVAEKINPASLFVWGAFAVVGYLISFFLWRSLSQERSDYKTLAEKFIVLMTKVETHLSSEKEDMEILREIRENTRWIREKFNEK